MNKIKNLRYLRILCTFLSNLMMVSQIILIVLMLLLSVHAFFQLLHNTSFDFMVPAADWARSVVKLIFADTIKASREDIDGEIVVFLVMNLIIVFILAQLKVAFKRYGEELDKKIVEEKAKEEVAFNQGLKDELQRNIASYNSYMIGFRMKATSLVADSMQIYGAEEIDSEAVEAEVMAKFIAVVRTLPSVNISKEDNILVITSNKFETVDVTISTIQDTIAQLKKEFRSKKIVVKTRLAIDAYKALTPPKKVFGLVKPLLSLNSGSDVLCYGNFNNRYSLLKTQHYEVYIKGKYDIGNSEETIWSLVKKV